MMMMGRGIPNSQSKRPLPKPIVCSFFFPVDGRVWVDNLSAHQRFLRGLAKMHIAVQQQRTTSVGISERAD
jgi:hypothetical protein